MAFQPPQYPQQPAPGFPPPGSPVGAAPPPAYGYPPAQGPVQSPVRPPVQSPRKRRKWPWVLGGVLLVIALGCVGLSVAVLGGAKNAVDTAGDNVAGKNALAGTMGHAARDGKFEFIVTKMECGKKTVGSGVLSASAQGSYCLVTVKVRNIGREAQMFDGSSQKAYDAKGTQYSNDSNAETYVNPGTQTWLEQINPGNQVTGTLAYDVPARTKLTAIELHDSLFSGGVKVPLK